MYQGCDLVTSTRNIFKMWVASDRWIQKWADFKQKIKWSSKKLRVLILKNIDLGIDVAVALHPLLTFHSEREPWQSKRCHWHLVPFFHSSKFPMRHQYNY